MEGELTVTATEEGRTASSNNINGNGNSTNNADTFGFATEVKIDNVGLRGKFREEARRRIGESSRWKTMIDNYNTAARRGFQKAQRPFYRRGLRKSVYRLFQNEDVEVTRMQAWLGRSTILQRSIRELLWINIMFNDVPSRPRAAPYGSFDDEWASCPASLVTDPSCRYRMFLSISTKVHCRWQRQSPDPDAVRTDPDRRGHTHIPDRVMVTLSRILTTDRIVSEMRETWLSETVATPLRWESFEDLERRRGSLTGKLQNTRSTDASFPNSE
ncbi:hypothetical protein MKZ38_004605 [Zalerion maritima]|uniref:Uncharacterized protein n=1 Tax=Zalerion maritima TaxID=339359 RepID=A0AAD5RWF8_9PEZI|nr:hypothetical protein MKZ38_004605 [Zalerion maritima]